MFHSEQVITATELIKNFKMFSKVLEDEPQALLITQKSNKALVLVSATLYEGLLHESCYNTMRRGENPFYTD